jgi:type IV pilus modification protein PilV
MTKYRNDHGQQGFTLIEVMMAMVILGIGIFALVALQTRNVNYNTGSKKQTAGYTWAMDQIEKLYVVDYAAVITGSATQGPYTVNSTVVEHLGPANLRRNTKTVEVRVLWGNQVRPVAQVDFTRTLSSF